MTDFVPNNQNDEIEEFDDIIYTLTDEDTGEEVEFRLIARATLDDVLYFAIVPANDPECEEYYIFRITEDGEDVLFESIDDDDEFEKVEEYFNDLLFSDVDYDD